MPSAERVTDALPISLHRGERGSVPSPLWLWTRPRHYVPTASAAQRGSCLRPLSQTAQTPSVGSRRRSTCRPFFDLVTDGGDREEIESFRLDCLLALAH
jgi:hypothetical protein